MPPLNHREPGVIGAACENDNVYVELICDGIHIHPSTVRATFKMFGDDRIVMISDSLEASGMPDGDYTLGGLKITLKGKKITLEDGTDCRLRHKPDGLCAYGRQRNGYPS